MDFSHIDRSQFRTEPFLQKVDKPWGYELILAPETSPYAAKILHLNAGKKISLQIHDQKRETFILMSGECVFLLEDTNGKLCEVQAEPRKGYSIACGQKHRMIAITDCEVFEASTPETGMTYRIEDDFQRPDETEKDREAGRKKV